ncbi:Exonuclease mut-7 [Phytophthora pseudosyringae]|uniref:Exonuclease mut-7 n=1 Tax=Phytophthora pseudosyringae TaxID=221518 RepID=A0A8T1VYG6_9STRA|nr:Exonuclease mut-7 [Phytophthora pseudosyringae]
MADQVDDAAAVEQQETLAQLFEQRRVQDAMQQMREWDSAKLQAEISLAFASVPHAPSYFLQCLSLYGQLPDKHVTFVSQWTDTALACMKLCQDPQVSPADSLLAGSMLPAFKRARMPFVADFALAYRVDEETLAAFCSLLLQVRVGLAAHFMECLKMKHLLPTHVVLEAVIAQKDFRTGDLFVKGHRENQQRFVQMLIDGNVQDKVIKKRLSFFKLKASAFPVYFERRQKATLRFLVYSKEYEQALQFVESSEALKSYACRMIIRHAGAEDPATKQFIFRAGQAEQFPEVDTSAEDGKTFKNQDEMAPLDTCLSLVDAIGEANIIFVDTPTALQECADHLMKQPAIGFDSEWKAVHVSADPNDAPAKCALAQLASREKAFVIDVVALYDHGNILAPLFQSESVIKLGFDTRGDVKALRPFLTGGYATDKIMSMLVDLQAVTRKLPTLKGTAVSKDTADDGDDKGEDSNGSANSSTPNREASGSDTKPRKWKNKRSKRGENDSDTKASRLGLTAIAETYLGLPLDKRARMSDWERRPLSQAQLHYAALDAHVLVQIYYEMQEQHPVDAFDAVLRRCTQKYVR